MVSFLGAEQRDRDEATREAEERSSFTRALAERLAPLLDRSDMMRLSVLATAAHDVSSGRVIVLDRRGRVALDTSMVLGDRHLGLLAHSGVIQRAIESERGGQRIETLAPVSFGGEVIGEVRLQQDLAPPRIAFAWDLFATVFLCCLSLVAVAAMMSHHWWAHVRAATGALIRIASGEVGRMSPENAPGELQELSRALARLERGLHDGLNRVAESYLEMAGRIVKGLESNGLVPAGHSERTARYAKLLAARLRLLPQDVKDLETACRLHDLGKAWVRASILQKRGGLDESERASLRQHPVRAADLLARLPELARVAQIIRFQGEHHDGSGHPVGLRGERIPIGSRILAIASAYDLLTVSEIDGCQLTTEAALEQLAQDRGTLFDPWLLDLFAEEVRNAPDEEAKPVLISLAGAVPYKAAESGSSDDPLDDEIEFRRTISAEIEVVPDDSAEEEA
ncbi:MAG: hypothetical protein Fur0037_06460 [Planctomycetota bacterium]